MGAQLFSGYCKEEMQVKEEKHQATITFVYRPFLSLDARTQVSYQADRSGRLKGKPAWKIRENRQRKYGEIPKAPGVRNLHGRQMDGSGGTEI